MSYHNYTIDTARDMIIVLEYKDHKDYTDENHYNELKIHLQKTIDLECCDAFGS